MAPCSLASMAHQMLSASLASQIRPGAAVRLPCLRRHSQRLAAPRAAADEPLPTLPPMAQPTATFPADQVWSWQHAAPKQSLKDIKQDGTATPFALSCIEAIHWFSFPLGFYVSGLIIARSDVVLTHLGGDPWRLFMLVLGLLSQVFGGGIAGNLMHEYEGWQVAPFRSPLALPPAMAAAGGDAAALRAAAEQTFVGHYNNAWLRSVAYQFLFSFQSFGIALFSLAVYGYTGTTVASCLALAALAFTLIVSRLGPQTRALSRYPWPNPEGPPVNPLSWYLLGALIVVFTVAAPAYVQLFGTSVAAAWPPSAPLTAFVAGGAAVGLLLRTPLWGAEGAAVGGLLWCLCAAGTPWYLRAAVLGLLGAGAATLPASIASNKPTTGAMLKGLQAGLSVGLLLFSPWALLTQPAWWHLAPWTFPHAAAAAAGAALVLALRALPLPAAVTAVVGALMGAGLSFSSTGWLAVLAPLCVAAGGIYEGVVAEATFDQWQHWRAFVILLLGLGLHGLLYWHLI